MWLNFLLKISVFRWNAKDMRSTSGWAGRFASVFTILAVKKTRMPNKICDVLDILVCFTQEGLYGYSMTILNVAVLPFAVD